MSIGDDNIISEKTHNESSYSDDDDVRSVSGPKDGGNENDSSASEDETESVWDEEDNDDV